MPGEITVAFRGFNDANFAANLPRAVKTTVPKHKPPGAIEESIIKNSLEGVAMVSPKRAPTIHSLLSLMSPPQALMKIIGAVGRIPIRRTSNFTITAGFTASAAAYAAIGAGAGVYFWNKSPRGEVGIYGSLSVGMITNFGFGAGDAFAYLFDSAPSVLAGDAIALEVDVELGPITVGGQLFMTAPPVSLSSLSMTGPWVPEIIGVGFTVTAGISVLPVNIAVMPTRTWIQPLTP